MVGIGTTITKNVKLATMDISSTAMTSMIIPVMGDVHEGSTDTVPLTTDTFSPTLTATTVILHAWSACPIPVDLAHSVR